MKKIVLVLVIMSLLLSFGCVQKNAEDKDDVLNKDWEKILKEADGTTVNLYMWGGSSGINSYFNDFVKLNLKEKYNITLNPVPVTDIKDIVNKVLSEKQANSEKSSVDIMWLNGENFKTMKSNDLLYGDLTSALPNFKKFIKENPLDFNEETNGLEVPFGKAQFVFVYDEDIIKEEIKTLKDLESWIKNNPGRFTYPSIPDFTGSAFIRHFFYGVEDEEALKRLKEINKYLWRDGETYPNNSGALDTLYSQGEIDFTMSYTPFHAINKVNSGEFSKGSRTLILEDGTLSNTHFLTIPYNAPNKPGALVAINYLISFEAQYEKMKPSVWGDLMVLKDENLSDEEKKSIEDLINEYDLDLKYFEDNRLNEFTGDRIEEIEGIWKDKIIEK